VVALTSSDPTRANAILDRLVQNAHRIELKVEPQRKLRGNRNVLNTSGTIRITVLFRPAAVQHDPVSPCDFIGLCNDYLEGNLSIMLY